MSYPQQYMQTYEVTLSSGVWHILAPNSEAAAWSAVELSKENEAKVLNVRLTDEW